jgi:uncharacterized protein
MADGMARFRGRVLLVLSGDDLSAQEFGDVVAGPPTWKRLLRADRITRIDLVRCDHTFSRDECRRVMTDAIRNWLALRN